MNKIIALIPAYCPGETLPRLVDELNFNDMTCIVVNDGSPEEYGRIFTEVSKDSIVLTKEKNEGKGAALKTGLKYIKENFGECVVVTADADGQHLAGDILRCAKRAEEEPDALVLGGRIFQKGKVPFKSYYGNMITEIVFHLFSGRRIRDTQTGLRAFRSSRIPEMLKVDGKRYEYEMNQLLYCVEQKIPIEEVAIETVYENNNAGSHFHPLRDAFLIYRKLIRFALSSFSGFLVDYLLFGLFSLAVTGTGGLIAANVMARVISAVFNYEVNRKVVFGDGRGRKNSAFAYAALAGGILICNTAVLCLLADGLGIPVMAAKIMTELLLFFVSWTIQHKFIFAAQLREGQPGRRIVQR